MTPPKPQKKRKRETALSLLITLLMVYGGWPRYGVTPEGVMQNIRRDARRYLSQVRVAEVVPSTELPARKSKP